MPQAARSSAPHASSELGFIAAYRNGANRRPAAADAAPACGTSALSDGLGPAHEPLAVDQLVVGVIQILDAPAGDITTFLK